MVLVFDPAESSNVRLLRFVMLRSGKRWEIRLPGTLRLADRDLREFRSASWRDHDPDDDDLKRRFGKARRLVHLFCRGRRTPPE